MCGISYARLDNLEDLKEYKRRLTRLDIRGRDYFGLGVLRQGEFVIQKFQGGATENLDALDIRVGDQCLAQNRLACFGLNLENTQPLLDANQEFMLVVNGNLLNHRELFQEFGWRPKMEVDSEIILRLVSHLFHQTGDLKHALTIAEDYIQGVHALILLSKDGQVYTHQNLIPLYEKAGWYSSLEFE
jgi:glucosamine 6-phosphate synthetase-like amidotransferase/phosphosugar isomerase protein